MNQVLSSLTKRELLQVMELANDLLAVRSVRRLTDLFLRIRILVPCENIISGLSQMDSLDRFQGFHKLINVSYPPDWIALYLEKGYGEVDPILKAHFRQFRTQIWSETFRGDPSPRKKEFISHARSFGLSEGITLGMVCRKERVASLFSFAGGAMADHARNRSILEYLVPHLHLAMAQADTGPAAAASPLSLREREVLEWIKEGKTSWEVSRILQISERTVNFHVQKILAKLQASTRGHAIALAIQQRLIGP